MTARRVTAIALAVLASGCSRAESQPDPKPKAKPESKRPMEPNPPATAPTTPTTDGAVLTWQLDRATPTQLIVTYSVENKTDHRIYVCDKLLVKAQHKDEWLQFPGISVQQAPSPELVLLTVGTPATDMASLTIPPVLYKAVEPGQIHKDTRKLKFPLVSANPMGMTMPLSPRIDKATLTVFAIDGEPTKWRELPAPGGRTLKVPETYRPLRLTAGPLPIP